MAKTAGGLFSSVFSSVYDVVAGIFGGAPPTAATLTEAACAAVAIVTASNTASGATATPVGYQWSIPISNPTQYGLAANLSNLRVFDTDQVTQLPFWVDPASLAGTSGYPPRIVVLPKPGSEVVGTRTLYLDNLATYPKSSITAVMDFADDFQTMNVVARNPVDPTKWGITNTPASYAFIDNWVINSAASYPELDEGVLVYEGSVWTAYDAAELAGQSAQIYQYNQANAQLIGGPFIGPPHCNSVQIRADTGNMLWSSAGDPDVSQIWEINLSGAKVQFWDFSSITSSTGTAVQCGYYGPGQVVIEGDMTGAGNTNILCSLVTLNSDGSWAYAGKQWTLPPGWPNYPRQQAVLYHSGMFSIVYDDIDPTVAGNTYGSYGYGGILDMSLNADGTSTIVRNAQRMPGAEREGYSVDDLGNEYYSTRAGTLNAFSRDARNHLRLNAAGGATRSSLVLGKSAFTGPYTVGFTVACDYPQGCYIGVQDVGNNNTIQLGASASATYLTFSTIVGAGSQNNTALSSATDVIDFHSYEMKVQPTTVEVDRDGATLQTISTNIPNVAMYPKIGIYGSGGPRMRVKDFYIRKLLPLGQPDVSFSVASTTASAPAASIINTVTAAYGVATIAFTDGANNNSAITSHKLYVGSASGGETLFGSISATSPVRVLGLPAGATYFRLSAVNAIGEGAQSAEVGPYTIKALPAYTGQVATRSYVPNTLGPKYAMARTAHVATDNLTSLQVTYMNAYTPGTGTDVETASGAALSIKVAVEYNGAILGTFTWGGATTGSIASGATGVSDALTLSSTIPVGATFYLRPLLSNTSGCVYSSTTGGGNFWAAAGECEIYGSSAVADTTQSTGPFTSTGTGNLGLLYPSAILGSTTKPTFALVGDSRTIGSQENAPNAAGDTGEMAPTIGAAGYGYINIGVGGDKAYNFIRSSPLRRALLPYCSHIIADLGINDIAVGAASGTGISYATAKADIDNLNALLATYGRPLGHSTKLPETTDTSANPWVATSTQALDANNAVRMQVNDYLRTLPGPVVACPDIASVLENAQDGGYWGALNGVAATPDGIHPTFAGYAAIQAAGVLNPDQMGSYSPKASAWSPYSAFLAYNVSMVGWWIDPNDPTCINQGAATVGGASVPTLSSKMGVGVFTATGTTEPAYTLNAINGLAALLFTAANSQQVIGSGSTWSAFTGAAGAIMASVVQLSTLPSANQVVQFASTGTSTANTRQNLGLASGGALYCSARRADADSSAKVATSANVIAVNTPSILVSWVDLVTGYVNVRLNGGATASTAFTTQTPTTWPLKCEATVIGGSNGSAFFNGLLGDSECIPLSTAQLTGTPPSGQPSSAAVMELIYKTEGRLAHFWGITLPSSHEYYNAPP